ncbi:MAG: hypothetical protein WD468_08915, partial [Pirellulales bacterium]
MASIRWFLLLWLCPTLAAGKEAPPAIELGRNFAATDTLACGADAQDDANQCLADLSWTPREFTVHLEAAEPGRGDWLVRFPSAKPIGNKTVDLVSMEWYAARDKAGAICQAPAVVVVHESGNRMLVGRLIAQSLNLQGLHT